MAYSHDLRELHLESLGVAARGQPEVEGRVDEVRQLVAVEHLAAHGDCEIPPRKGLGGKGYAVILAG